MLWWIMEVKHNLWRTLGWTGDRWVEHGTFTQESDVCVQKSSVSYFNKNLCYKQSTYPTQPNIFLLFRQPSWSIITCSENLIPCFPLRHLSIVTCTQRGRGGLRLYEWKLLHREVVRVHYWIQLY